jgi:hypothetical protein
MWWVHAARAAWFWTASACSWHVALARGCRMRLLPAHGCRGGGGGCHRPACCMLLLLLLGWSCSKDSLLDDQGADCYQEVAVSSTVTKLQQEACPPNAAQRLGGRASRWGLRVVQPGSRAAALLPCAHAVVASAASMAPAGSTAQHSTAQHGTARQTEGPEHGWGGAPSLSSRARFPPLRPPLLPRPWPPPCTPRPQSAASPPPR